MACAGWIWSSRGVTTSTATCRGTSNPKVAFNWAPIEDFTIRGTWGTSFRAPVFGELSPLANVAIAGQNLGAVRGRDRSTIIGGLRQRDLPPVGSGAWKLMSSWPGGDGTPGSAIGLPDRHRSPCRASRPNIRQLPGISMNGGSGGSDGDP